MLDEYGSLFIKGTVNTMIIAVSGTLIGFAIGLGVGVLRTVPVNKRDTPLKKALVKLMNFILAAYVEIFRGTPMIVQSMVIYYGLFGGVNISKMVAGVFIVSINTGSYMAEIVRGGILSVDYGQSEGALSIGMNHFQTMRYVVLPQAIRNIMPSIGNEFVVNIKDSSVLSVISVFELFFAGKSASGTYWRYFEVYTIIAVIYFILTFGVTRLLRLAERRMDGPGSFTVTGSQTDSRSVIKVKK